MENNIINFEYMYEYEKPLGSIESRVYYLLSWTYKKNW